MTSRKPPSKLDRLLKSHLRLLKAFRHQTNEIGELRKVILEMRPKPETPASYPEYFYRGGLCFRNVPYQIEEADVPAGATPNCANQPNDWPRL